MSTLRRIQAGLGIGLVTAFAFVVGSASADDSVAESDDASTVEQAEAQSRQSLRCTMSGYSLTGREWGEVFMTRTPGVCRRVRIGGQAPPDFPSCHQRARELGCYTVVD